MYSGGGSRRFGIFFCARGCLQILTFVTLLSLFEHIETGDGKTDRHSDRQFIIVLLFQAKIHFHLQEFKGHLIYLTIWRCFASNMKIEEVDNVVTDIFSYFLLINSLPKDQKSKSNFQVTISFWWLPWIDNLNPVTCWLKSVLTSFLHSL